MRLSKAGCRCDNEASAHVHRLILKDMQLSDILIQREGLDTAGTERGERARRESGSELREILVRLGVVSVKGLASAPAPEHALQLQFLSVPKCDIGCEATAGNPNPAAATTMVFAPYNRGLRVTAPPQATGSG